MTLLIASCALLVSTGLAVVEWKESRKRQTERAVQDLALKCLRAMAERWPYRHCSENLTVTESDASQAMTALRELG